MFCSNCGANVVEGAEFCHSCGAKMLKNAEVVEKINNQKPPKKKKTGLIIGIIVGVLVLAAIVFGVLFATGVFDKATSETTKTETTEKKKEESDDKKEDSQTDENKDNVDTEKNYITVDLDVEFYDENNESLGVKKVTVQLPKDKIHEQYYPNVITDYEDSKIWCVVRGEKHLLNIEYQLDESNGIVLYAVYSSDSFTMENYLCGLYQHVVSFRAGNTAGIMMKSQTFFGIKGEILLSAWGENEAEENIHTKSGYTCSDGKYFDDKGNEVSQEDFYKNIQDDLTYVETLLSEFMD